MISSITIFKSTETEGKLVVAISWRWGLSGVEDGDASDCEWVEFLFLGADDVLK